METHCKFYKKHFFEDLLAKCKEFYTLPGCGCGGPLHILLDDDNITDEDIIFCIGECEKETNKAVKVLGLAICHSYLLMSNYERMAFDWFWNCNDLVCKRDGDCEGCYICELEDY